MSYTIGTAGHIDHGKTSLVKALTGQDTDRLKAEKERGISIELGFAHLDLKDGTRVGVIDVPGHERFVRTMLAGAHGLDLVIFVVAADDGVMPQTEEHFEIVELLGINKAIFVITKADLMPAARIAEVAEQIEILVVGSPLEGSACIAFSSRTLQGLAELNEQIDQSLKMIKKPAARGYFRLPVDRAFLLPGRGLIVTGTAVGGVVRTEDLVRCAPGDHEFRVRGLEVHGTPFACAGSGQRVALNLSGAGKSTVARGDVICDPRLVLRSDRFDAFLRLRRAFGQQAFCPRTVHLHLGTAQCLARLRVLNDADGSAPAGHLYCQLTLPQTMLVMRGDRFVVRDPSGQRTVGGGVVVHPWAKTHKRSEQGGLARLESLRMASPRQLIEQLFDDSESFALPAEVVHQFLGVDPHEVDVRSLWSELLPIAVAEDEEAFTTTLKLRAVTDQLLQTLAAFHVAHPLEAGMDLDEARREAPCQIAAKQFRVVTELLVASGALVRNGSRLHLKSHLVQTGGKDTLLSEAIKALLAAQSAAPPDLAELEKRLGVSRAKLMELLRFLETDGAIVRIDAGFYLPTRYLDDVRGLLCRHLAENGSISVAAFRDLTGSSRKYAIPLLMFYDREGITKKVGDLRTLKAKTPASL
ncbi:MAG: selenocysteine-specific translation elongation factor [Variovorax sp.]